MIFENRWKIFWIFGFQYLLVYLQRVSPAICAQDLMTRLNISATSMGFISSSYFYSYGFMQLPMGILVDSLGPKKVLTYTGILSGLGSIAFGLSWNFESLLLSRTMIGLGVSSVFVSTLRIVRDMFRPTELGRVSGLLMMLGGLGWFMATFPLAHLLTRLGFRFTFVSAGLITLALTLLGFFALKEEKKSDDSNFSRDMEMAFVNLRKILRDRHFITTGIWFLMRGGALFGFFGLWAGPYLMEVYSLPKDRSGQILSMIAVAMVSLGPAIGYLSDRVLKGRKKVLVYTSILNCGAWLILLVFFDSLNVVNLFFTFFVLGMTVSSVGTLAIISVGEHFPKSISGLSMGAINFFPFLGGMIFQPFLGYILDYGRNSYGSLEAYRLLILTLFISSLLALSSILLSRETLKA